MILFLPLAPEIAPLPGGVLQVTASLEAALGPNASPPHPVDPTALRKASVAFIKGGADLSEMFKPSVAGEVDDVAVAADGSVIITATVSDPTAVRKVRAGVYKVLGLAVRVRGRDPIVPDVISAADVIGVSLVDGQDDAFGKLAKAWALPPTPLGDAALQIEALTADVLGLAARLRPYERPAR